MRPRSNRGELRGLRSRTEFEFSSLRLALIKLQESPAWQAVQERLAYQLSTARDRGMAPGSMANYREQCVGESLAYKYAIMVVEELEKDIASYLSNYKKGDTVVEDEYRGLM